jgi:hypothetical protein
LRNGVGGWSWGDGPASCDSTWTLLPRLAEKVPVMVRPIGARARDTSPRPRPKTWIP